MQDVVVIGAGLIGCGIAYELAKRGASVTVYDRAEPARAASWAGAGMLAPYSEEVVDPALLALCAASLRAYPAFVEELRERTGVDAQLRHEGTLHVAFDDAAAVRSVRPQRRRCDRARSRRDVGTRADAGR
jgi:glycine oxidase